MEIYTNSILIKYLTNMNVFSRLLNYKFNAVFFLSQRTRVRIRCKQWM